MFGDGFVQRGLCPERIYVRWGFIRRRLCPGFVSVSPITRYCGHD